MLSIQNPPLTTMACHGLLLLIVLYFAGVAESAMSRNSNASDFIQASCKATHYPGLCVQCLAGYASTIHQNEQQLTLTALSVSIASARLAADSVRNMTQAKGLKPREYQALKDCIQNMGDSVDSLSRSTAELGLLGRTVGADDYEWHRSNLQTWVSSALTHQTTCLYGFASVNGNIKLAIKLRITSVARVTSNALALVNRFAMRHAPKNHNTGPEKASTLEVP